MKFAVSSLVAIALALSLRQTAPTAAPDEAPEGLKLPPTMLEVWDCTVATTTIKFSGAGGTAFTQ
jgi:hypothetical protein